MLRKDATEVEERKIGDKEKQVEKDELAEQRKAGGEAHRRICQAETRAT